MCVVYESGVCFILYLSSSSVISSSSQHLAVAEFRAADSDPTLLGISYLYIIAGVFVGLMLFTSSCFYCFCRTRNPDGGKAGFANAGELEAQQAGGKAGNVMEMDDYY